MISSYLPMIKKPKEGVNYTPSLLEQSMNIKDSTKLANEIIKKASNEVNFIVQIAPGLGTFIYALMQSDRFEGVYTFAKGKNASVLENNIEAWGLEDAVNINERLDYTLLGYILPKSIVVIDLLQEHDKEQMLLRLKKASMIVIRSNIDIDTSQFEGFNWEKQSIDRSNIYYLEYINWDEKSKKKWVQSLKNFLKEFLPNFINPKSVDKFLTDEAMEIWENAFTSETLDPENNYELLELIGDRVLEYCMTKFLLKLYPSIKKGQLNELKSKLVKKTGVMAKLSRKYHLTDYVRAVRITKHTKEDIYESFMGALSIISDNILDGSSYKNCYNFVVYTYSDETNNKALFPEDQKYLPIVPSITGVRQYFNRIGFGTPKESVVISTQQPDPSNPIMTQTIISLPEEVIRGVSKLGITIPKKILGKASDIDKKESEQAAFDEAFKYLTSLGMTEEWVEKTAQMLVFQRPNIKPYYLKALEMAKNSGYVDIIFDTSSAQTTYKGQISTLIGVLPDGTQERLSIGQGANRNDAMENAIKNYVEYE